MVLGAWGEARAVEYLQKQNYKIFARNWRYKNHHEIDIVAAYDKTLIAVEVKTHHFPQNTKPFEQVTTHKIRQIKQALELYSREFDLVIGAKRIDVISVVKDPFSLEHFCSVDFVL